MNFDYTVTNGNNVRGKRHRPTARQIVSDWKKAGKPRSFTVEYCETFAAFEYSSTFGPTCWRGRGNGCRGVDRNAIVKALQAAV
jgi:hypothetical protein